MGPRAPGSADSGVRLGQVPDGQCVVAESEVLEVQHRVHAATRWPTTSGVAHVFGAGGPLGTSDRPLRRPWDRVPVTFVKRQSRTTEGEEGHPAHEWLVAQLRKEGIR